MRRLVRVALAVAVGLAAVLGAASGVAARGQQQRIDIESVDTSRHPSVVLTVTAPPTLLGVTVETPDWTVLENGTARPVRVRSLNQDVLSVVLVIDTSGSMAGLPLARAKAAATSFLDALPANTAVAVVGFGDQAQVAGEFTTQRIEAVAAIDGLQSGGETALHDAVNSSLGLAAGAPGDRTSIVVLTDGGDTASTATLDETRSALGASDAGLAVIELPTEESEPEVLRQLAAVRGGQVFTADPDALAGVYDQIADQLVNQYEVTYTSTVRGATATTEVVVEAFGTEGYGATDIEMPAPTATTEPPEDRAVAAASGPVARTGSTPGPLASAPALWIGAVLTTVAAFVVAAHVRLPVGNARRSLVSDRVDAQSERDYEDLLHSFTDRASEVTARILERAGTLRSLDRALENAGLEMRPGEFAAVAVGASAAAGLIIGVLVSPLAGIVAFLLGLGLAPVVLGVLRRRRRRAFNDQLGDTLVQLSATLRAGYGLSQAIDMLARESPRPSSDEFARVVLETRLGRPLDDALEAVAQRTESEDFAWVVDAVRIQQDVGGDLAQVLDNVALTIRSRAQVRRQLRALTAEGRSSALTLMILPFVVAALVYSADPNYLDPLFERTLGRVLLGGGILLMVIGAAWLRRVVEPEF